MTQQLGSEYSHSLLSLWLFSTLFSLTLLLTVSRENFLKVSQNHVLHPTPICFQKGIGTLRHTSTKTQPLFALKISVSLTTRSCISLRLRSESTLIKSYWERCLTYHNIGLLRSLPPFCSKRDRSKRKRLNFINSRTNSRPKSMKPTENSKDYIRREESEI